MQGISSLGLVILGNNLPVSTIDLDDFEDILGPLTLDVRAPIAIQAKSGTSTLLMMENRVAVDWSEPIPGDARERMAKAIDVYANEYAGKRGPTAMGQNFQGALESTIPGREILRSFLDTPRVDRVLMSEAPPGSSLTLFFKRGRETRAQVVLSAPDEDPMKVSYAFNFHFDLTSTDGPTFMEALQDWEKSERFAEESVEALVALINEGGS